VPKPPTKRKEVKVSRGIELWGFDSVLEACAKEIKKNFITYKSLALTSTPKLEPDALFVPSQMLVKRKSNGSISARLPLGGDRQTPDTYGDTYAGTSNTTNRIFLLTVARKDAADRGVLNDLIVADTDLPGAFLHNDLPRSQTGGRQLYTRLPKDLPDIPHHLQRLYPPATGDDIPADPDNSHYMDSGGWSPSFKAALRFKDPSLAWTQIPPIDDDLKYASRIAEVLGCVYGLKQSNAIFDKDLKALFIANGWTAVPSDPHTFVKTCPFNPLNRIICNWHVDDAFIISNTLALYDELQSMLRSRYVRPGSPDLVFHDQSAGVCGVGLTRNPDHSFTFDMSLAVAKLLSDAGMDLLPPALSPSMPGLFAACTPSPPVDPIQFQRVNGGLVYLLPIRHDIRKETPVL
jgi:hypothetical protein